MNMTTLCLPVAKRFRRYLLEQNAFQSDSIEQIHIERWSTRIFLVLFLVGIVGVFIYASTIVHLTTVVVTHPSYATIDDLRLKYADLKIKCPCTKSAIPRASFTRINISYHQVLWLFFTGINKSLTHRRIEEYQIQSHSCVLLNFFSDRFVQVHLLVMSGSALYPWPINLKYGQ
jgi:hypothetical protein